MDRLSLLSEASGEDRFKAIAYHRAATSVRNLGEDIEAVWKRGELEEIQYVGEGIARKIDEYLREGRMTAIEKLEKKVPVGAVELMQVPGVGPRTAYKLAKSYGVKNVEALREGLGSGKLVEAVGQVMAKKIQESVEKLKANQGRMLLVEASYLAKDMVKYFTDRGVKVEPAGSLRRRRETVGDIDLLTTKKDAADVFVEYPGVDRVIEKGATKTSVFLKNGIQVDLRVVAKEEYGAAMLYFTGSKEHNIALRNLAIESGWKLNEYGLFEGGDRRVAGRTEEEVYGKLGLEYIPPELREARGEIEAAKKRKLPDLVAVEELKGDLQMHSTWSDGKEELGAMAKAAKDRGYEYMAITDHSISVGIANGLDEARFKRQWKEIDDLNRELKPFKILKGVEAEVKSDGSLDFDRRFFENFDIVGASVHQSYRQSPEKLTERAVMALAHPCVDFLCHPTNRLIGRREGHRIDLTRIIKVAKDNGKLLEIDGSPNRLDLDDFWARRAMEEGVKLLVDSDAHSTGELENVEYGVYVARRAWLESKHVGNTLHLKELSSLLT